MSNKTDIEQLREIILGLEIEEIRVLKDKLDDPAKLAVMLGKVLPEAVDANIQKEDPEKLAEVLKPIIINTLHKSVKENSKPLADALFPVMGPAIRKAISETLKKMLQAVNETLENSLSPRSIRWRMQSWFTGKPYTEIVLLNTLEYRVIQVFLIHKESGILLQQAQSNLPVTDNADMVSGMLRAIQDFVKDSFNISDNNEIDTIEFGEHTIWIKQGPDAILASVVEGNAPKDIGVVFEEALEKIHPDFYQQFEKFDGDTTAFENDTAHIEACLVSQSSKKKRKKRPVVMIIAVLAAALIAWWVISCIITNNKYHKFTDHLNNSPGLVVIESEKSGGSLYIRGLRDPLAEDPVSMAGAFNIKPEKLVMDWKAYIALSPEIILKRANLILHPPSKISLGISNDTLSAEGIAAASWVNNNLVNSNIPGISYILQNIRLVEKIKADSIKTLIEQTVLHYETGVSTLDEEKKTKLDQLYLHIKSCFDLNKITGDTYLLYIDGGADTSGALSANIYLSRKRSENIMYYLTEQGIPASMMISRGVGETGMNNKKLENQERCVKFDVVKR